MPRKPIIGEVSLQDLLDRLAFAEEETQSASLEQAKLFMAAATYRIKKMRTRQRAEADLDDIRLDRSLKLRAKHAGAKKSLTEKALAELVDSSPSVRQARDLALDAKQKEEWSKLLLDAYEHRRSAIKVMAQYAFLDDNYRPNTGDAERLRTKRDQLKAALKREEE